MRPPSTTAAAREAVASNPLWYHTIDVAPGVSTPGAFDLRPVVERLPWPDVRGKRCLDVGTYDGFLAFELERRGAAEVVATDIADHAEWDHEVRLGPQSIELLEAIAGQKGAGFAIARELLGSSVEKVEINAYDLSPERVEDFDVVVCGSLLLHLRDPLRALAAIRSVCRERFMSIEQVDPLLTWLHPRRPLVRIDGTSGAAQWWVGNAAGHVRMLEAAGFDIEERTPMYAEPLGVGHPSHGRTARGVRAVAARMLRRGEGVPHAAALARRTEMADASIGGRGERVAVAPQLSVRRGRAAIEFYKDAFGAQELYRVGGTDEHEAVVAQLGVGEGTFWVADESPEHLNFSPESLGGGSVRMLLVVAEPDAAVQRAVAAGATEVSAVTDEHGWRLGRIVDPFGHHWEIGRPLVPWPPPTDTQAE